MPGEDFVDRLPPEDRPDVEPLPPRDLRLELEGLATKPPPGWEVRIRKAESGPPGGVNKPVVHAATVPMPARRGDYGSGVVDRLGPDDVFVSMIEFGQEAVGSALFAAVDAIPIVVDPDSFHPLQLQRRIPGQAGVQRFFTYRGRAFCQYIVIGSYLNRGQLAEKASALLASIEVEPAG